MKKYLFFEAHLIYSSTQTAQELWNANIDNPQAFVSLVDSRTGEELIYNTTNIVFSQIELFLHAGFIPVEEYYVDYPNGKAIKIKW